MVLTIKFSQMTAGGDLAPGDNTPGLLGGANVLFSNPWTFLAPGSTANRPPPSSAINYRLRFNTDTQIYEYYDAVVSMWVELSGSGTGTINPGLTNDIPFYPANGTALSPLAAAANAVLVTSSGSVPSLSTTLPSGLSIPGATITSSTAAITSGQVVATPVNPTDITNKSYVDTKFASGVTSIIQNDPNQVIVSNPTGTVTLSLPQDIGTGNSPTFSTITLSSTTVHGVLVGQAGSAIHSITPSSTSGVPLISQGVSSDPIYGTAVVSGGGTGDTSFTAYSVICGGTTSTGALQNVSGVGTANQVLTSNGPSALPTWQNASASGAITQINGDSGSVTPTAGAITISGGTTGLTTSGSSSTLDLTGTLAILHGGTGVTSVTTSPTATAFAGWDANKNLSANNHIEGFTSTATAASMTVLTVSSTEIQQFTGTTTQTVTMPVASTLVEGQSYFIINNSTGVVTVQSSGANTIQAMASNTTLILTCILNSGTTAASWNATYIVDSGGGVSPGTANQLAYYATTGNVVSGLTSANSSVLVTSAGGVPSLSTTLPNINIGTPTAGVLTNCTGLPVAGGGTGNSTFTAYSVICAGTTATGAFQNVSGVGTSGQVLTSNGVSALPSWKTVTAASTAPTVQKFTSSSGTYTTPTSPAPLYIRVVMVGGGGGGAGSSTAAANNGGNGGSGGNSTFGTSLLVANGGSGGTGTSSGAGGLGGTASLGSGPIGIALTGGTGGQVAISLANSTAIAGQGANSAFGGAGPGSSIAGVTNTGGGGGGASLAGGVGEVSGSGGGAGGYIDAIITSLSATFSYAVGGAGSAGSAGTSGGAGGAGGSGMIVVFEFYQ